MNWFRTSCYLVLFPALLSMSACVMPGHRRPGGIMGCSWGLLGLVLLVALVIVVVRVLKK